MQNEMAESLDSGQISQNDSHIREELSSDALSQLTPFLRTAVLTFFGIFGTFICSFVFAMYVNKKSLRTPGNTFVLSLTTSDFLRGAFLLPSYIFGIEGSKSGKLFCTLYNFFSLWINLASILSILLVAMDRNRAVKDPFQYVKNSSKRRAAVSVIFVWILSLLVALPILFGFPEFDRKNCDIKISVKGSVFDPVLMYELAVTLTAFVMPLFSVAFLYHSMYRAAKNNTTRDERNSCSSYGSSDVVVNMKSPRSSEGSENNLRRHTYIRDDPNYRQSSRFLKKHRAAVTGLIAVVSLIVCFTPYFILRFCQLFRMMTIEMNFWFYFPTFISTVINPYIYFFRNHSTKKMAAKFFHRKKTSNYLPTIIRSKIVNISDVYRNAAGITQAAAVSQPMETGTFSHFLKTECTGKLEKTLYKQGSQKIKDSSESSAKKKQFSQQNSTWSNSSSDLCHTIASFDSDEPIHYQSLKRKYSGESSSEEKH